MDDSGSVNGDEFLSLAETLTGEVAFGNSSSFQQWIIDNGTMDPEDPESRVGLWYLERADHSDISDEDYQAIMTIVKFIDEHYGVTEWGPNGKIKRNLLSNAMDWLVEGLQAVPLESLEALDVDGNEELTWDELQPAIWNQCGGFSGGIIEDELGFYSGTEMCQLEQTFYWSVFQILDVTNDGEVTAEEFGAAAEILTGEFAFGDQASLVDWMFEKVYDPENPTPRLSLWTLENSDHSDISDEDFEAVKIMVEFLD